MLWLVASKLGSLRMTEPVLDSDLHLNYASDLAGSAEIPLRGWRAGDLVIDLELRRLYRDGRRVALQETPLRLLCLLLERGGRPVARRELHEALWPRYEWDSFERNVNTAVRKLRQAIGDDAREPRLIETMRASGYRWIGQAPEALSAVPEFEAGSGTAAAGHATPATAIASRPAWRRWSIPGAIASAKSGAGPDLATAPEPALVRIGRPWPMFDPAHPSDASAPGQRGWRTDG